MSKKSIPVKRAQEFAKAHDLKQVIIFGWDGKTTHVLSYGDTIEACAQAAEGANRIKKKWGWPEELITESSRVQALLDKIKRLEAELESYRPLKKDEEAVSQPTLVSPAQCFAYVLEWTEFERGWGQRPEGYLLFASQDEAESFIARETADRTGPAPDCYDQYTKIGYKPVTGETYTAICQAQDRRIWLKDYTTPADRRF